MERTYRVTERQGLRTVGLVFVFAGLLFALIGVSVAVDEPIIVNVPACVARTTMVSTTLAPFASGTAGHMTFVPLAVPLRVAETSVNPAGSATLDATPVAAAVP